MQDKIDCNNINGIREERNANSIYISSATSRAYVQSSSNPLEIFTNFVKFLFTTSEHPRDPFPLCSRNSQFKRQPVSWLHLTFWDKQKDFSPLEWMIQIEVPGWNLNRFASVCPRVVERAFGNEFLLEYLSLIFWSQTHIYTVPSCLFKNGLKMCLFKKLFLWNSSLVIDYMFFGNRLHSYILKGHVFSKCLLKCRCW